MVLLFHSAPGLMTVLTTPTLSLGKGATPHMPYVIGKLEKSSIHKNEGWSYFY